MDRSDFLGILTQLALFVEKKGYQPLISAASCCGRYLQTPDRLHWRDKMRKIPGSIAFIAAAIGSSFCVPVLVTVAAELPIIRNKIAVDCSMDLTAAGFPTNAYAGGVTPEQFNWVQGFTSKEYATETVQQEHSQSENLINEPATILLLGTGLVVMSFAARKRTNNNPEGVS